MFSAGKNEFLNSVAIEHEDNNSRSTEADASAREDKEDFYVFNTQPHPHGFIDNEFHSLLHT